MMNCKMPSKALVAWTVPLERQRRAGETGRSNDGIANTYSR
jgi:hypothetical protein